MGMNTHPLFWPIDRFRRQVGDGRMRSVMRRLPSAKRCKQCYVPFIGAASLPFRAIQIRPSRKNPNLCTI